MPKFSVKTFIVYFIMFAVGGILYSVVRSYIPFVTLSVKEKELTGIFCLASYFLGNAVMFVFYKLCLQKAT